MSDLSGPKELASELKNFNSFAIFGHVNPDGDCLGSSFALRNALVDMGKKAFFYLQEELSADLKFFSEFSPVANHNQYQSSEFDAVIVLDSSDRRRMGGLEEALKLKESGLPIFLIDHHTKGDLIDFCDYYWCDEKYSSTCEMVLEILQNLKYEIRKNVATLLLAGIETDTFSFQNQNTNENSFSSAAYLISRGARLGSIIKNAFEAKTINIAKIYGLALERLHYNSKYKTAISYVMISDLEKFGVGEEAVSGIANYLNSVEGIKILFLISESKDGTLKINLRTRDNAVDLAELARLLGGGGHKKASGFTISGRMERESDKIKVVL